jgi:Ring finger domain
MNEESIDKHLLNQDINSESNTSMNDNKDIMECSICLEYLGKMNNHYRYITMECVLLPTLTKYFYALDDSVMFGPCRHYYHRACIMEWMTEYHDECPTCRQRMWDLETFKAVESTMRKLGHL